VPAPIGGSLSMIGSLCQGQCVDQYVRHAGGHWQTALRSAEFRKVWISDGTKTNG